MYKHSVKILGVMVLLFISGAAFAAEKGDVKVAVASAGAYMHSKVSLSAARAPFYLIFNKSGNITDAVKNPAADAISEASVIAANFLAQNNITIFIAGDIGPKMADALKENGIRFIKEEGRACDAVSAALNLSVTCEKR